MLTLQYRAREEGEGKREESRAKARATANAEVAEDAKVRRGEAGSGRV
jgi:hypothetical protein